MGVASARQGCFSEGHLGLQSEICWGAADITAEGRLKLFFLVKFVKKVILNTNRVYFYLLPKISDLGRSRDLFFLLFG
jgi:hypothetical protein